jgi:hypothetical protein
MHIRETMAGHEGQATFARAETDHRLFRRLPSFTQLRAPDWLVLTAVKSLTRLCWISPLGLSGKSLIGFLP